MQVKAVPNGLMEHVLGWTNRLPIPVAETFGAMMLARAVEAACELGLFEYLGRNGSTHVFSLCQALSLNTEVVSALLRALALCGYVVEENDHFRNTAMTQRFLVSDSPAYVGNFVRYNTEQRMIWMALEPLARDRSGQLDLNAALKALARDTLARMPDDSISATNMHHLLKDGQVWHKYMHGLKDLANLSTAELQLHLRFPGDIERLLDIGGGHAAFSIWMCRRYPKLRATIYDLESPARVGEEIVAQAGLSDRIRFVTGDVTALADFGPTPYDVVFCFNLLHHLTESENVALIGRAARALRPGGTMAVLEEFEADDLKEDALARLVAVMFLLASGGNTLTFETVTGWMQSSGISSIKRFRLRSTPGIGLLRGWKD